jgi:hypothetical protein
MGRRSEQIYENQASSPPASPHLGNFSWRRNGAAQRQGTRPRQRFELSLGEGFDRDQCQKPGSDHFRHGTFAAGVIGDSIDP